MLTKYMNKIEAVTRTKYGSPKVLSANAIKILNKLNLLDEIEKVSEKINEMRRITEYNEF
ncbi:MAG: hypothetical protein V3V16_03530 [Melioribacteraceae bacterium]